MNALDRRERFAKKYSAADGGPKKEMNVMPRRGPGGPGGMMRGGGKPKNTLKTLGRLLAYLSHERKLLISALVAALVYTAASLISSYMLRPVMNLLTEEGKTPSERMFALAIGIALMAFVYAVSIFSQWLQQRLMLAVSQRSLKRMRSDLYRKI
jgi:ATP-binding cassette subfamily B protein